MRRVFIFQFEVQVDTVYVAAHGKDFLLPAAPEKVLRPLADQVHHRPGLGVGDVVLLQAVASPRISQMVETDAVDAFILHQLEDGRYLLVVKAGYGQPQGDAQTQGDAVSDSPQGAFEGALSTSKAVVVLFDSIQAYSHLGKTDILQLPGFSVGNQGAVGGQGYS